MSKVKTWREVATPIIHKVLQATKDKSEAEIKKALFDAYPFGPRRMHPYKIWLDEIKRQRGKKGKGRNVVNAQQTSLFQ